MITLRVCFFNEIYLLMELICIALLIGDNSPIEGAFLM